MGEASGQPADRDRLTTHAPHSALFDLLPAPPNLLSEDERMNQTPTSLIELYDWIIELRQLYFRLGVQYEDLGGSRRTDKIRKLILSCQWHTRLEVLQNMVTR